MKNSEAGRRFREASGTGRRGRLCTPGNSQEGNPSHRNWQTKIGTTIKTHAHTHTRTKISAGNIRQEVSGAQVTLTWLQHGDSFCLTYDSLILLASGFHQMLRVETADVFGCSPRVHACTWGVFSALQR